MRHAWAVIAALAAVSCSSEARQDGPGRLLCTLANRDVVESSGIAVSRRTAGVLWTHNDSGDQPRLFAFNTRGEDLGTFQVRNARARDWEDMASISVKGTSFLLIGDIGDNDDDRQDCAIYVVPEPAVGARAADRSVTVSRRIRFRYEDGPRNCESLGFCSQSRHVFLVEKTKKGECGVYVFPLAAKGKVAVAKRIATLRLPKTTAMDIAPDGRRMVVLTYGDAYEYVRAADENWPAALARAPKRLRMPTRRKGESVCYRADGQALYLTSEARSCPLWEVPLPATP